MSKITSITNARKDIYKISEEVCEFHEEVHVYNNSTGKNMVILSEEDWNSLQETLNLYRVPGFVDSLNDINTDESAEWTAYDPKEEW